MAKYKTDRKYYYYYSKGKKKRLDYDYDNMRPELRHNHIMRQVWEKINACPERPFDEQFLRRHR